MQKGQGSVWLVVLTLLIAAGALIYILYDTAFTLSPPNGVKDANIYSSAGTDSATAREDLNQRTGILGQVAFTQNAEVLGTLYDVYVDETTGEIKWVSINIEGNLDAALVLLQADKFISFGDQDPIIVDITKEAFLNLPVQNKDEEELKSYVSIRGLPNMPIMNTQGQEIGRVKAVTYNDGVIDKVIFSADELQDGRSPVQIFSVAFKYLKFFRIGSYDQAVFSVGLTERQIGAIEAYMTLENSN